MIFAPDQYYILSV